MHSALSDALRSFIKDQHNELLCTANRHSEPSVALMGTPRLLGNGTVDFEIRESVSTSFDNIRENAAIVFMAYFPGPRARDYYGARLYAKVREIWTSTGKVRPQYTKK
ncbi:hypothetical protein H8B02_32085 [Bradyrhizobium sp. Pear77]|uniref:hypothetical protein n=1 Tax=Bradyrhizobium altum TaxID=1571202 RepID=UPI001E54A0D5|nr:hypothetical protein [Bradyrhizobium altum]MCC8957904.1 hypothetical protein [Bradyrhizobium altum]